MSIDLAAASSLLSAIASTGKIIEFAIGLKGRRVTAAEADKVLAEAEQQSAHTYGAATSDVVRASMSEDIAEAVRTRMEAEKKRIKTAIIDEYMSQPERDERISRARREYCWAIFQIKASNGDSLPPDLQKEWELNGCSRYNFI